MVKRTSRGKIWIPTKALKTYVEIKVDDVSVLNRIIEAEFTHTVCPDIGHFKIVLNNNDRTYSYSGNEDVEFLLDRTDGTTTRFKGKVERIKNDWGGGGNTLTLEGSHISSPVLDITVTEEYLATTTASYILKAIIEKYLTGFTYKGVEDNDFKPTIRWVDKPFWDCVADLLGVDKDNIYDCYVDDDLDFKYFKVGSKFNKKEAIVWSQNLVNVTGLGEKILDVRNKVRVYGEDDEGLPVISTATDTDSQSLYGEKPKIIKDSNITDKDRADELANSELEQSKDAPKDGKAESRFLMTLRPGDTINIDNPPQNISGVYRIAKFTHKFPLQRTVCSILDEKNLSSILKNQSDKQISTERSKNPYNLDYSYNFPFDNEDNIASKPTNMIVSDGALILSSGNTGTMISKTRTHSFNITKVQLQVVGESISNATFSVSCDGGVSWTVLTVNELTEIDTDKQGTDLVLKIVFASGSVVVKSVALLYS